MCICCGGPACQPPQPELLSSAAALPCPQVENLVLDRYASFTSINARYPVPQVS
jgi:hypothetical protein